MSLINDALKKAQRQRTGDAPPVIAPVPGGGLAAAPAGGLPRVAKRPRPAGFQRQLLFAAGGLLLVIVVATAAFFLGRRPAPASAPAGAGPAVATSTPPPTSTPPAPAEPRSTDTAEPRPPAPLSEPRPPITDPVPPAFVLKTVPVPQPVPEPAPVPVATPTPPPVEAAPAAPAARPRPTARMVALIEGFRVTGIRAAGADAKVLMNDRLYRLGDIVDHELGLRLTGATTNSLTFEDEHGATYTRNF